MTEEVIAERLGRIEEKVDGVNDRLDRQNGRIGKTEERVTELEHASIRQAGALGATKYIVGLLGALAGGIGTYVLPRVLDALSK